ncbi:hypothetical protein [Pedobacter sp. UBA5917]|jgi:hypothetical protein|uniref:hypothetical protein n=1 Tax=Pedobacter sp. UBA5917 TaxID=1947061 RepID=UPI0025ED1311|nr:hypothetical protein [Pedobacter sp. UBA5917]
MKNLSKYALKIAIVAVLSVCSLTGCKKDETRLEPVTKTTKVSEIELSKLLQFVSITTTAPKDQIVYNEQNEEFVVYGWYHKSLADVRSEYSSANEYKATYEK